jgi:RNA polymerase sigma-70 factor (ECF subfamily)
MMTFDEFFADHYDEVVRALSLAVSDRGRAEDAAQEAFARAYRKWSTVATMDRPVGWVIVVAMNQLRRWFARVDRREGERRRRAGLPDDLPDPAEVVAATTTIRTALEHLPPRQRATVVLRFLCDLPTDEVARALGCAPGTVKSNLHRALANLRVELRDLSTGPAGPARTVGGSRDATR